MFHSAGIRTDSLCNMEYKIIYILRSLKYTFWMIHYICYKKTKKFESVFCKDEWKEWTNKQMNKWKKERKKEKRKKGRKEGRKVGRKEERNKERKKEGRKKERKEEIKKGRKKERKKVWMNEWKWMSEWMNKRSLTVLQIIFKWEGEWLQFCREFLQKQHCSVGVYGILQ